MSVEELLVEVYSVRNAAQQLIVRQLLHNVGIQSRCVNDGVFEVFGKMPYLLPNPWPRICVRSSDVPKATTICQEFDRRICDFHSDQDDDTLPYCFHCGEEVSIDATSCEHCGGKLRE